MDAASRPQELTTPAGKRAKVPAPRSRSIDVRLARRLLMALGNAPLEFVLGWSGERVIGPGSPVAQIRFADRATLWSVAADPRVSFGDAYSEGRVQIEGDLLDLLEIIYRSSAAGGTGGTFSRLDRKSVV